MERINFKNRQKEKALKIEQSVADHVNDLKKNNTTITGPFMKMSKKRCDFFSIQHITNRISFPG